MSPTTTPTEPQARRPVAVVTGASGGIGRATACALAEAGYDIGLVARGAAGLEGAVRDVEERGGRALACPTDVADYDQVVAAADAVEDGLGQIDLWVNDAMTTSFAPSWDLRPDDFQRAVEVTFLGQVWGTLVALDRMRPRDEGTIINVGSALSFLGIPLQSPYCAAKFACRGFFESVRSELLHEHSHVRMCMVHMPAVNTPQFGWCANGMDRHPQPVPPIYQPEVAARAIVRTAADGKRSRVVGSWNRMVVLAGRFTPGLGNQFAARGAWETQLTDRPADPGRPVNLRHPVDDHHDHGARGIFDDRAGGVLDPSFLRSLPTTVQTLVGAAAAVSGEHATWFVRTTWSERARAASPALAGLGLLWARRQKVV